MGNEARIARTLELYSQLDPTDPELRSARIDIRDEIFNLNYQFFHHVTHHTHLDNNRYGYEDKFQEVCAQFLEIWWWYQYPPRFKTPVAWSTYFRIRLKERTERELNELSYSMYRSTMIECQKLLDLETWTQVKPEMLQQIQGHSDLVHRAMRMFNRNQYYAIEDVMHLAADNTRYSDISTYCDAPDSVCDILISEMLNRESPLTDSEIEDISDIYTISFYDLSRELDNARVKLFLKLKDAVN